MSLSKKYFNSKYLKNLDELRENYINNKPFPHIVLDDFLNSDVAESIIDEFPSLINEQQVDFENNILKKRALSNIDDQSENIRNIFYFLNSASFISWLNIITGIKEQLIGDPLFFGGGLHECFRGGFLKVHIDYHKHPKTHLDRRLNCLIYLNKNWKKEFNGELELWSQKMDKCEKKIEPIFNRLVIFSTTDKSYHGHPDFLNCPESNSRKSIATWYYTNGRTDVSKSFLFKKNTTFWVNRKDSNDNVKNLKDTLKDALRKSFLVRGIYKVIKKIF